MVFCSHINLFINFFPLITHFFQLSKSNSCPKVAIIWEFWKQRGHDFWNPIEIITNMLLVQLY